MFSKLSPESQVQIRILDVRNVPSLFDSGQTRVVTCPVQQNHQSLDVNSLHWLCKQRPRPVLCGLLFSLSLSLAHTHTHTHTHSLSFATEWSLASHEQSSHAAWAAGWVFSVVPNLYFLSGKSPFSENSTAICWHGFQQSSESSGKARWRTSSMTGGAQQRAACSDAGVLRHRVLMPVYCLFMFQLRMSDGVGIWALNAHEEARL